MFKWLSFTHIQLICHISLIILHYRLNELSRLNFCISDQKMFLVERSHLSGPLTRPLPPIPNPPRCPKLMALSFAQTPSFAQRHSLWNTGQYWMEPTLQYCVYSQSLPCSQWYCSFFILSLFFSKDDFSSTPYCGEADRVHVVKDAFLFCRRIWISFSVMEFFTILQIFSSDEVWKLLFCGKHRVANQSYTVNKVQYRKQWNI